MSNDPLTETRANIDPARIILRSPNLTEALELFTSRLGFRVEMILPADAPRVAVVSGHGVTLRLEAETEMAASPPPASSEEFVLSRMDAGEWKEGRAGMQYRDLIPGRLGGRFIASHIRIPGGGETPDYVHFHKVRFQMIYCKAGWARVVYEDQGPPFVLEAGDCVLQPPEIRHRVLESSAGLEVVEIACPAVHETHADHVMKLPTARTLPERLYGGQRFVLHRASEAKWTPWILAGFESRDTGIAAATGGMATARIVRTARESAAIPDYAFRHTGEFFFLFILRGELTLDSPAQGNHRLQAGDSCVLPAGINYTMQASGDLEMLEACFSSQDEKGTVENCMPGVQSQTGGIFYGTRQFGLPSG
jgi:quercetin dioxygenase-like cupin family protein